MTNKPLAYNTLSGLLKQMTDRPPTKWPNSREPSPDAPLKMSVKFLYGTPRMEDNHSRSVTPGTMHIMVRGPLGEGVTAVEAVVEKIEAIFKPPLIQGPVRVLERAMVHDGDEEPSYWAVPVEVPFELIDS